MTINLTHLDQQLVGCGFQQHGDKYRRGDLAARSDYGWLTFLAKAADGDCTLSPGAPGFWKNVSTSQGERRSVFDLPLAALSERELWDDETGDALSPVVSMVGWVDATRTGDLPTGWKCPPRETLEEELPQNALTVEAGGYARQGQLICTDERLAVAIPLLPSIPTNVPSKRIERLYTVLSDIQNQNRLVRMLKQQSGPESQSIWAEVDLTAAPSFVLPLLLRIGLDAVRHVVSQHVSAIDLLVDPAVTFADGSFH